MEKNEKLEFRLLYADGSVSDIWDPDKQAKMFELKKNLFVSLTDAPNKTNWHNAMKLGQTEKYGSTHCRIPTSDELREIHQKEQQINDIRQKFDCPPLTANGYYWSSATPKPWLAEVLYLKTGWIGRDGKMGYGSVLFVADI